MQNSTIAIAMVGAGRIGMLLWDAMLLIPGRGRRWVRLSSAKRFYNAAWKSPANHTSFDN